MIRELDQKSWLTAVKYMAYYFTLKTIYIDPIKKRLVLKFWSANEKNYIEYEFIKHQEVFLKLQDAYLEKTCAIRSVTVEQQKKLERCWFEGIQIPTDNTVEIKLTDGFNHHQILVVDSEEVVVYEV